VIGFPSGETKEFSLEIPSKKRIAEDRTEEIAKRNKYLIPV
jgi:hypothetical protein